VGVLPKPSRLFLRLCVLLPDLLAVHRPAVVGAEGNEFAVGGRVVDAAPLDTLQVVIVPVHEVHGADEEGVPVKFTEGLEVLADQGLAEDLPELGGFLLLALSDGLVHVPDAFEQGGVLVDGPALFEFFCHLFDGFEEGVHVHHPVDRNEGAVILDKYIGGSTTVLVGGEPYLGFAGIGLDQVREGQHAGHRVEVVLF